MVLIRIVLFTQTLANLTDQVQVAVSLRFFTVLVLLLVLLGVILLAWLHFLRGLAGLSFALLLLGQTADAGERVTVLVLHEVIVPDSELADSLVSHVGVQDRMIISSIQAFATEL